MDFEECDGARGEGLRGRRGHHPGDRVGRRPRQRRGGAASGRREGVYEQARTRIGRAILLGLEVLIIADIVLTITVEPTVEQAIELGIIVLVRTFLSFSIEIELEGVVPWRRRAVTAQAQSDP